MDRREAIGEMQRAIWELESAGQTFVTLAARAKHDIDEAWSLHMLSVDVAGAWSEAKRLMHKMWDDEESK